MRVRKRERVRLAKSEVLLLAAMSVQRWADDVGGRTRGCRPFDEWPADDPMRELARRYQLAPRDLDRVCVSVADELERRAERAGYAETWQ